MTEAILKGQDRSPWLFLGRDGGPLTPGAFWQNVWRPLLRSSGLRYRKPHTLRHTYASLLIQNRESLAYVRDQLGNTIRSSSPSTPTGSSCPGRTGPS